MGGGKKIQEGVLGLQPCLQRLVLGSNRSSSADQTRPDRTDWFRPGPILTNYHLYTESSACCCSSPCLRGRSPRRKAGFWRRGRASPELSQVYQRSHARTAEKPVSARTKRGEHPPDPPPPTMLLLRKHQRVPVGCLFMTAVPSFPRLSGGLVY